MVEVFLFLLVLTLAFRPDGVELAVATLDGQILFWDVNRCDAICVLLPVLSCDGMGKVVIASCGGVGKW